MRLQRHKKSALSSALIGRVFMFNIEASPVVQPSTCLGKSIYCRSHRVLPLAANMSRRIFLKNKSFHTVRPPMNFQTSPGISSRRYVSQHTETYSTRLVVLPSKISLASSSSIHRSASTVWVAAMAQTCCAAVSLFICLSMRTELPTRAALSIQSR